MEFLDDLTGEDLAEAGTLTCALAAVGGTDPAASGVA